MRPPGESRVRVALLFRDEMTKAVRWTITDEGWAGAAGEA